MPTKVTTPNGTEKDGVTKVLVATPEFEARLDAKQERKSSVKLDTAMQKYEVLLDRAAEDGFLYPSRNASKSKSKGKTTGKAATTMSIKTHQTEISLKDQVIKTLRTDLSNAKRKANSSV